MSNYIARTKHPETGEIMDAAWLDDFFADNYGVKYGVKFDAEGRVWPSEGLEQVPGQTEKTWLDFHSRTDLLRIVARQDEDLLKLREENHVLKQEKVGYHDVMDALRVVYNYLKEERDGN